MDSDHCKTILTTSHNQSNLSNLKSRDLWKTIVSKRVVQRRANCGRWKEFENFELREIEFLDWRSKYRPIVWVRVLSQTESQKFRPWSVAGRGFRGWGGRFSASFSFEWAWNEKRRKKGLVQKQGGGGERGDKEAEERRSRVSEGARVCSLRCWRGERTTADAKIPPRSVHPYRYPGTSVCPCHGSPSLIPALFQPPTPSASQQPTVIPTNCPKSPTRLSWLDSGTPELYL